MVNPYLPPSVATQSAPAPYPSAYVGAQPGAPSELAIDILRQTRPWALLLGVVTFLGAGLLFLGSLLVVGMGFPGSGGKVGASMRWLGLVYLPFALLYVYPAAKMWSYGRAIGRLLASRSNADLEAALGEQKSLWKFFGVTVLAVIGLYVVVLFGAMVVGVMKATRP